MTKDKAETKQLQAKVTPEVFNVIETYASENRTTLGRSLAKLLNSHFNPKINGNDVSKHIVGSHPIDIHMIMSTLHRLEDKIDKLNKPWWKKFLK